MKILLDENLPRKLKFSFASNQEIFTVRELNWLGKRNGELLGLIAFNGIDAFVTIDKNLQFQQNLGRFSVRVFVLNAPNNKIDTLEPCLEKLNEMIDLPLTDQVTVVTLD